MIALIVIMLFALYYKSDYGNQSIEFKVPQRNYDGKMVVSYR